MTQKFVFTAAGSLAHGESLITGGYFAFAFGPSSRCLIEGIGIYSGPLIYTFIGGSDLTSPSPLFVPNSIATVAPQTIDQTAIGLLADGSLVIRDGDLGTMNCQGALVAGGMGTISGQVICVASQDKVLSE